MDRGERLTLIAGDLLRWSEVWLVQATSRWHLASAGPSPVQTGRRAGAVHGMAARSRRHFAVTITEPKAASGPVKTVETARLAFRARAARTGSLTLTYRAGQGDMGRVTLPEGARLDNLKVNGNPQPLTQREGRLALPLQPGLQTVEMAWKQDGGIGMVQKTPKVILGDAAANVSLSLQVPGDRWVLWLGGLRPDPPLLLWGVVAVLARWPGGWAAPGAPRWASLDWLLLFLGTSTVNVYTAAPLLILFLALRARDTRAAGLAPTVHNLLQLLLGLLAVIAFGFLVASVPQGLLSAPDMQVTGNGSNAHLLRWFQDRTDGPLPVGRMFSVPLWPYRVAMLAWSLWLAFRLLNGCAGAGTASRPGACGASVPRRSPGPRPSEGRALQKLHRNIMRSACRRASTMDFIRSLESR